MTTLLKAETFVTTKSSCMQSCRESLSAQRIQLIGLREKQETASWPLLALQPPIFRRLGARGPCAAPKSREIAADKHPFRTFVCICKRPTVLKVLSTPSASSSFATHFSDAVRRAFHATDRRIFGSLGSVSQYTAKSNPSNRNLRTIVPEMWLLVLEYAV